MRDVLVFGAIQLGAIMGSLRDPVFLLMLIAATIAGGLKAPWWAGALLAMACGAIRLAIAINNSRQLGITSVPVAAFTATAIAIFVLFAVLKLIRAIRA